VDFCRAIDRGGNSKQGAGIRIAIEALSQAQWWREGGCGAGARLRKAR